MERVMTWTRWSLRNDAPRSMGLRIEPPTVSALRLAQWALIAGSLVGLGTVWYWWEQTDASVQRAAMYELSAAKTEEQNRRTVALMAQQGLTMAAGQEAVLKEQIIFANQLSSKRDFSWTRLLSDLEAVVPETVSIGSVRVDFSDLTVSIVGSARTLTALNRFVEHAQNHPAFRKAVLQNHHLRQRRDEATAAMPADSRVESAEGPVDFTLTVAYHPAFE